MRFLDMVGYYRSLCKNFSSVVALLIDLLKAKAKYTWSSRCQEAFESVKALLCSAPVLAAPHLNQPYKLHIDASNAGAGAVLLQANAEGVDCPVSYFSRKFKKYQYKYSSFDSVH